MQRQAMVTVRPAERVDVAAVCRFGETHVRAHYAPLIGVAAADEQVRSWWNATYLGAALEQGCLIVAEAGGTLVGVGQRGRNGADHVVYKLYVDPAHRGTGLGPRLLEALIDQLPAEVDRLHVEHVAANVRAGGFYEREGFAVERIEPAPGGDAALDQVWRVRRLGDD